jgi:hypothetical protein
MLHLLKPRMLALAENMEVISLLRGNVLSRLDRNTSTSHHY